MKKRTIPAAVANFPITNAGPRGQGETKTPGQVEQERVAREAEILGALGVQLGNVENELKKPFVSEPKFKVAVADINGVLTSNVIDENTPELLDAPQKSEE